MICHYIWIFSHMWIYFSSCLIHLMPFYFNRIYHWLNFYMSIMTVWFQHVFLTQLHRNTFSLSLHNSVFVSHSILIHVKVRNSFEINVSSMSQTPSHPFHTQPPRSYLAQTSHSIQNLSEKPFESSKKIIQTLTLFHYSKLHFSFIILSRLVIWLQLKIS